MAIMTQGKITKAHKLGYMLAGFKMAHSIIKDWIPTGNRTGNLMVALQAREEAILAEVEAAIRCAGRKK